jgi:hypothetical protein
MLFRVGETMRITYDQLNDVLIEVVPELGESYRALRNEWVGETPGPHVVYGDMLNPFIVEMLSAPVENHALLVRVFGLLERLASHPDVKVQEVVQMTVCERLGQEPLLATARTFMGPSTLQLSHEIETFWGT